MFVVRNETLIRGFCPEGNLSRIQLSFTSCQSPFHHTATSVRAVAVIILTEVLI